MNVNRLLLGSFVAGAGLALAPRALKSGASDRPASGSSSYDALDAYVGRQMRRLRIPGASLAVVEGDRIVHTRGFGRSGPGGEAPTAQTPFYIGSLTKSITALGVMQLVEAGRIVLDAPVQRYLPWFRVADPEASGQITVRHLLNQTSGLPAACGDIPLADFDHSPGATVRQVRALTSVQLAHPIGSACEYSNMNYNVLGLVIEAASGEPYADYVREHIFSPLGMKRTYTSRRVARQHDLAVGHRFWFGIPIPAPNLPIPRGSLPSGQLISTAQDMARTLVAHLNGGSVGEVQILSAAGIDELHRGVREYSKMGVSAGRYGMGWFVGTIGETRIVWHSGTTPDFGAFTALLPEQSQGLVLLFNACHYWYNPVQTELGMGATALLAGESYCPTPFFTLVPWMLPAQLLLPLLQLAGVALTIRKLRRWRLDPESRPSGGQKLGGHIVLPLIPNLLVALGLRPMLGRTRGYLIHYMPDTSWLARVCGSFALAWSVLRTALVLRALGKDPRSQSSPVAPE